MLQLKGLRKPRRRVILVDVTVFLLRGNIGILGEPLICEGQNQLAHKNRKRLRMQSKEVRTGWVTLEFSKVLQLPICACCNLVLPSLTLIVLGCEMNIPDQPTG